MISIPITIFTSNPSIIELHHPSLKLHLIIMIVGSPTNFTAHDSHAADQPLPRIPLVGSTQRGLHPEDADPSQLRDQTDRSE